MRIWSTCTIQAAQLGTIAAVLMTAVAVMSARKKEGDMGIGLNSL